MPGNIERKGQLIVNIVLVAALAALWIVFLVTRDRIAYVDTASLLNQSNLALEAQSALESKIGEFQAEIARKEQEIQVLRDVYEKSEDKATIQAELEDRIATYQEYTESIQTQFEELRNETMTPVYASINDALEQYGDKRRFHLILGATSAGNVVFGRSAANITDAVVEFVNRRPPEGAAE